MRREQVELLADSGTVVEFAIFFNTFVVISIRVERTRKWVSE